VAPLHRDRGPLRGHRTLWGGRARVRVPRYMGTWVAVRHPPVLKAFSARRCRAGTVKKVALIAGMRTLLTILNARVKPHKPWHVQEVPSAYQTRPPGQSRQVLCCAPAIGRGSPRAFGFFTCFPLLYVPLFLS
jgi:hypothetical protein